MSCDCPEPALCQRLRRHIAGRDWQWWTNTCSEGPCDPEIRRQLMEAWERNAATLPTLKEQRQLYRKVYEESGGKYTALAHPPKPRRSRKPWRAVVFLAALWRHVSHGLPTASPEDQARRLAICDACEWQDKEKRTCKQCGCHLKTFQLLSKVAWAQEACPLLGNRPGPWWGPVKGETIWARAWRWLRERFKANPHPRQLATADPVPTSPESGK